MNKAVFAELRKAKDGNGNYYLTYGKGITSGFEWQLLGKPVYVSENMPEPTAAGNIPVLYGDFAGMARPRREMGVILYIIALAATCVSRLSTFCVGARYVR